MTKKMDSNDNKSEIDITRLGDFAHEIRTPLNAMLGYAGMIKSELDAEKNEAKLRGYAETIETATVRLLKICERVLDDAIAGDRSVKLEPVNISDLAREVADTFSELAAKKGIAIKYEFPDDFPELNTDPILFGQVLSNLVGNAIKFSPVGGSVLLRGEIDAVNRALVFVIRDTGSGIPADVFLRIRRGEKVSTTSKIGKEGWGRGLKIAIDICNLLDIDLNFAEAESGGTVVSLSLPLAAGD